MTLWVFGYGSLLWNPGFEAAEKCRAKLDDYHRSFCMLSVHYRGSVAHPGLVLALAEENGATCTGVVYRVAEGDEADVLTYLRDRELISSAYLERYVTVTTDDGKRVEAVTYVIDPDHDQFCDFPLETQAQMIASAIGERGPNCEYLWNTMDHLDQMGIRDADMTWLAQRVRELRK